MFVLLRHAFFNKTGNFFADDKSSEANFVQDMGKLHETLTDSVEIVNKCYSVQV